MAQQEASPWAARAGYRTGKTRVSISLCKLLDNNNWIKSTLPCRPHGTGEAGTQELRKILTWPNHDQSLGRNRTQQVCPLRILHLSDDDQLHQRRASGVLHWSFRPHHHRRGRIAACSANTAPSSSISTPLLIGLTATPRAEIDKNTFRLLELENEPNFEYTYDEAIADGYLCPYRLKKCNSKMINRGIRYDDLSSEQQEQLEKVWGMRRQ